MVLILNKQESLHLTEKLSIKEALKKLIECNSKLNIIITNGKNSVHGYENKKCTCYDKQGSHGLRLYDAYAFSNSDNMNKFATLYDCLGEYSKPGVCPVDESGRISAHRQSLYHLEQIGLLDNLRLCDKNWHDDCPTVRRRYFKEK